jgi:hypothetical protein
VLDDVMDLLPEGLDAAQVRGHVLISRSFDRSTGQLLLVDAGGRLHLLSRPDSFELFREIPVRADAPFALVEDEYGPRLEVCAIDDRTLRVRLLEGETAGVEALLARRAPSTARRHTVRPPESAEAEVVVVPQSVWRQDAGAPEPVRGDGAAQELARQILREAEGSAAAAPAPSSARDRSAHPSSIPPALSPSPEALARAAGEAAPAERRESVHPPAFGPEEPLPAIEGPRDTAGLRKRLRWHWELGQLDEASQVARVLVYLGSVDPTESRLASFAGDPVSSVPITKELFAAHVAHEHEDPDIARVCAALWPALLSMRLRSERDLGLRARDEIDVLRAESGLGSVFRRASRALDLPTPRLWLRADLAGGLAYLNVSPTGSLAGASIASGFSSDETLFVVAHHLAFYRPEVYLLALLPSPSDLLVLVSAGLCLERRMPADARTAKVARTVERFMVPQVRESLRAACAALPLPTATDRARHLADELARFRRAAHVSASRAAFALTGSISTSARMTRLLPPPPGLTVHAVVDDLASYAVSAPWFTLRRALGIAPELSAPEFVI